LQEPRIALTDEADGLTLYRSVLQNWVELLTNDGTQIFECAAVQKHEIELLWNSTKKTEKALNAQNCQKMSKFVKICQNLLQIIPTGELKISEAQKENRNG
jgi:methylase of polypeptide subunit release factors